MAIDLLKIFGEKEIHNVYITDKTVKVNSKSLAIYSNRNSRIVLKFLRYNSEEDAYKYYYKTLKNITYYNEDITEQLFFIMNENIRFSYYNQLNSIYQFNKNSIKNIEVSTDGTLNHQIVNGTLYISWESLINEVDDINKIYKKTKSYADAYKKHLINEYLRSNFDANIKSITTINKGELSYIISRLNLSSKSNKKETMKYLNKNDLSATEDLMKHMISKSIFDGSFLRYLDEYLLKEKLHHIIDIGEKILDIGTDSLDSDKAQNAINLLGHEKEIKQLETLWQVYFEKYLLFLIFTYKHIFPKLKLNVEEENKFPDFVGINHYSGLDIIEIKTHKLPALRYDNSHKNFAFSGKLSDAIIQTTNYIDALIMGKIDDSVDSTIKDKIYESNEYRPQGLIIISSEKYLVKNRSSLSDIQQRNLIRDFTKLRNSLNNIKILTFDEILKIARLYTEHMK